MLCSCPSTHRVPRRPTSKGLRLLVTSVWQTGTEIFTNVNSTAWFRIRPSSVHSNTCWTKDLLAVTKLSLQNEALAKVPTWDYSAACSGLWSITHTILSLTPLTHPHFLLHYEGLSIDISCHISQSHLFSSSDTPSLWVYYLAAVFVNTIMSLVLRAPQTSDHRPVFADSSDSSASSAFQSQKSHFPPSPLPASGPRGGIFLAAAQSRTPSITKSPRGVEVPKTFWQDSDIATSAVKNTLSSLHSLVPPDLNGFIVSEGFWRSEQKYLQSRFDRKFCND